MGLLLLVVLGLLVLIVLCLTKTSEGFDFLASSPKGCPRIREASRRLWYYHVDYTRDYLIRYLDDIEGADESLAILMKNQEDLGQFIDTLAPGTQEAATSLLKEHIAQAGDILEDAKEGRDMSNNIAAWYRNADDIAKALAPPLKLCEQTLRNMMHEHLRTTLDEATAHLQGDKCKEDQAYKEVVKHILMMANYLVSTTVCHCH